MSCMSEAFDQQSYYFVITRIILSCISSAFSKSLGCLHVNISKIHVSGLVSLTCELLLSSAYMTCSRRFDETSRAQQNRTTVSFRPQSLLFPTSLLVIHLLIWRTSLTIIFGIKTTDFMCYCERRNGIKHFLAFCLFTYFYICHFYRNLNFRTY